MNHDQSEIDAKGEHGVLDQGVGICHKTQSVLEAPISVSGRSQLTSSKRASSKGTSQMNATPNRSTL